jgi:hypothetical protein
VDHCAVQLAEPERLARLVFGLSQQDARGRTPGLPPVPLRVQSVLQDKRHTVPRPGVPRPTPQGWLQQLSQQPPPPGQTLLQDSPQPYLSTRQSPSAWARLLAKVYQVHALRCTRCASPSAGPDRTIACSRGPYPRPRPFGRRRDYPNHAAEPLPGAPRDAIPLPSLLGTSAARPRGQITVPTIRRSLQKTAGPTSAPGSILRTTVTAASP